MRPEPPGWRASPGCRGGSSRRTRDDPGPRPRHEEQPRPHHRTWWSSARSRTASLDIQGGDQSPPCRWPSDGGDRSSTVPVTQPRRRSSRSRRRNRSAPKWSWSSQTAWPRRPSRRRQARRRRSSRAAPASGARGARAPRRDDGVEGLLVDRSSRGATSTRRSVATVDARACAAKARQRPGGAAEEHSGVGERRAAAPSTDTPERWKPSDE